MTNQKISTDCCTWLPDLRAKEGRGGTPPGKKKVEGDPAAHHRDPAARCRIRPPATGPASKGGEGRNAAGEASPAANLQKREGKGRIHHGSERERERREYLFRREQRRAGHRWPQTPSQWRRRRSRTGFGMGGAATVGRGMGGTAAVGRGMVAPPGEEGRGWPPREGERECRREACCYVGGGPGARGVIKKRGGGGAGELDILSFAECPRSGHSAKFFFHFVSSSSFPKFFY